MNYIFDCHDSDLLPGRFYGAGWKTCTYNYARNFTIGKLKAIRTELLKENGRFSDDDYFWFPDPDHEFESGFPGILFDAARALNLHLCAPAYTANSDCSHTHLKTNGQTSPRRVDFIDLGCPMFSYAALRRNLWTFDLNYSGWGVDFLWGKKEKCFVLDWLTVNHPGPTAWETTAAKLGFPDPHKELAEVRRLYL